MRALRAVLAVALALAMTGCAHGNPGSHERSVDLRAMTYNIRLDLASDGANAWPNRAEKVAALIAYERPAVLGMQEVLLHQKTDLERALPEYAFAGVGRDDGADGGEFSPVAWRRERFELLDSGTFWLSPTPDRPGKAWDAAYPRIATWALLRERGSGRRLRVLNTHFDHVGTEARARSAEMIADRTAKWVASGEPVVVMGDFNSTPESPPIVTLSDTGRSGLRLARALSLAPPYGPPGTFNAFKFDSASPAPIDHIFVSSEFRVMRYAVVTQHWEGRLPSDHFPVVVDLEWSR